MSFNEEDYARMDSILEERDPAYKAAPRHIKARILSDAMSHVQHIEGDDGGLSWGDVGEMGLEALKTGTAPAIAQGVTTAGTLALTKNPTAALAAGSVASGMATKYQQDIGLEPKSDTAIAASIAAPPLFTKGWQFLKAVASKLPGMGYAAQKIATSRLRGLPGEAIQLEHGPSEDLYKILDAMPDRKLTLSTVPDLAKKLAADARNTMSGGGEEVAKRLDKIAAFKNKAVYLSTVRNEIKQLGQDLKAPGVDPKLKAIYHQIYEDIETSATKGGGGFAAPNIKQLQMANQMRRREGVIEDLTEKITKGGGIIPVSDGRYQVNGNAMIRWLDSNKEDIIKRLGADGEDVVHHLDEVFHEVAKYPKLPPAPGVLTGSSHIAKVGSVGAGAATAIGVHPAVGAGVAVGSSLLTQALLRTIVDSPAGAKFVVGMLKASKGTFGDKEAGMLGAFMRGAFANQTPKITQEDLE